MGGRVKRLGGEGYGDIPPPIFFELKTSKNKKIALFQCIERKSGQKNGVGGYSNIPTPRISVFSISQKQEIQ